MTRLHWYAFILMVCVSVLLLLLSFVHLVCFLFSVSAFHFHFTLCSLFPFVAILHRCFCLVLSCFHYKKMNYGVGRHKCKARSLFSSLCLFRLFRHIVSLFQQKLKANIRSQRHIIKGCRDQQKCPFFFEYNFEWSNLNNFTYEPIIRYTLTRCKRFIICLLACIRRRHRLRSNHAR